MTPLRIGLCSAACALAWSTAAQAQNRGVYPLGMSAINSGVTPGQGFTYSNQMLFYARDAAKDDDGATLPITGTNAVVMDMNSFTWVGAKALPAGARYSATATLPIARNQLTSDLLGDISGGAGFADSYYLPLILGWTGDRAALRVMYGFLAPTGRFAPEATDNVGSGYWTSTISSGQTLYASEAWALSAFEMYEFHTAQKGTGTQPGDTFDLDYSVMRTLFGWSRSWRLQLGVVGYAQRQTTAKTGSAITPAESQERYGVNAIGFAANAAFPSRRVGVAVKYFEEFANRSTFQGFSLQFSGAISF
jgi:hypothetical protein